jgi:hypothetical protein
MGQTLLSEGQWSQHEADHSPPQCGVWECVELYFKACATFLILTFLRKLTAVKMLFTVYKYIVMMRIPEFLTDVFKNMMVMMIFTCKCK